MHTDSLTVGFKCMTIYGCSLSSLMWESVAMCGHEDCYDYLGCKLFKIVPLIYATELLRTVDKCKSNFWR